MILTRPETREWREINISMNFNLSLNRKFGGEECNQQSRLEFRLSRLRVCHVCANVCDKLLWWLQQKSIKCTPNVEPSKYPYIPIECDVVSGNSLFIRCVGCRCNNKDMKEFYWSILRVRCTVYGLPAVTTNIYEANNTLYLWWRFQFDLSCAQLSWAEPYKRILFYFSVCFPSISLLYSTFIVKCDNVVNMRNAYTILYNALVDREYLLRMLDIDKRSLYVYEIVSLLLIWINYCINGAGRY